MNSVSFSKGVCAPLFAVSGDSPDIHLLLKPEPLLFLTAEPQPIPADFSF